MGSGCDKANEPFCCSLPCHFGPWPHHGVKCYFAEVTEVLRDTTCRVYLLCIPLNIGDISDSYSWERRSLQISSGYNNALPTTPYRCCRHMCKGNFTDQIRYKVLGLKPHLRCPIPGTVTAHHSKVSIPSRAVGIAMSCSQQLAWAICVI